MKRLEPETLRAIELRLEGASLSVRRSQRTEAFVRYQVSGDEESVVLDLVAEPVPAVSEPDEVVVQLGDGVGSTTIQVDSRYEILVNELNALVSRTELRDLVDLDALVTDDVTLERAPHDAARKDGGFSPIALAACLTQFPVAALATRGGLDGASQEALTSFARSLADRVARASFPD